MKTFGEKVKDARVTLGLSQPQLAQLVGVSDRSIKAYEQNEKSPRATTMQKLAKALQVSVKFLTDDSCENPMEDIEKDDYIAAAREQYGSPGARDMESLLAENTAFFAGGSVSQEQKDALFEALMTVYITSKEEAKKKFGRKEKA